MVRFPKESQSTALLHIPNICPVKCVSFSFLLSTLLARMFAIFLLSRCHRFVLTFPPSYSYFITFVFFVTFLFVLYSHSCLYFITFEIALYHRLITTLSPSCSHFDTFLFTVYHLFVRTLSPSYSYFITFVFAL